MTELIPIPCQLCGVPVVVELDLDLKDSPTLERWARKKLVHYECNVKHEARVSAAKLLEREAARQTSWNSFCPAEFQKPIDWTRRAANRSNSAKVMDWNFGEKGLLVTGDSGKCKTRFVWRLLNREWDEGKTLSAHTHVAFRQMSSALAAADSRKYLAWIAGLTKVDVLFIDDLGKGRATPASEEGFFDLLDKRMRDCKPTLFTTDMELERIERHFSDEYQRGLMRRILERTTLVEF